MKSANRRQRSILRNLRFFICIVSVSITLAGCKRTPPVAETQKNYVSGYVTFEARRTYQEIGSNKNIILVDVRRPDEYLEGHIPGALSIPLERLSDRVAELDRTKLVIFYSRMGVRSQTAAHYLAKIGYSKVATVSDGLVGWMKLGAEVAKADPKK